jgi:N-acetylneuraminic acid mutarotase
MVRSYGVSFTIGDKFYVGGGHNWFTSYATDFWEYNTTTRVWTAKAAMPIGLQRAAAFEVGGHGYVVSGLDSTGTAKTQCYRYDPATNTWSSAAPLPTGSTGLADAVGFSVNGKGYIALGNKGSAISYSAKVYEYDPTADAWVTKGAAFPRDARDKAVAFVSNGKAYVGLGYYYNNSTTITVYEKDFYAYDQSADSWSAALATFPGDGRASATAFSICGLGYVGLGYSSLDYNDFYRYNPTTNTWNSSINNFPISGRYGVCTGTIDVASDTSYALVGMGYVDLVGMKSELYRYYPPTTCIGTAVPNVNAAARNITVAPVPTSNTVMVSSYTELKKYEIADCSGRAVAGNVVNGTEVSVNLENFTSGAYFITVYTTDGAKQTLKIIKM